MKPNKSSQDENKYSESALGKVLERKEELERIRDSSPVISFLWKAEVPYEEENWPVEYVSGNVEILGYTADEFLSGDILYADIVHPDDLEELREALTKQCNEGVDFFDHKYRIILKSGEVRWVNERTYVLRDKAGNVAHYQGTIFDITEQKEKEQTMQDALRKKQHLEEIINNSSIMVFLWRNEQFWPADYASDNVSKLGYPVEDFVEGRIMYSDLIHPDDYEMVKNTLAEQCDSGSDYYNQEYRLITKDNKTLWVSEKTFILRDRDGNVTHFQGIVQDITKEKENEIALKQSLEKQNELLERKQALETIINHSPVVAFLWKAEPEDENELWPVEFVSDNINQFGYSVDEFLSGEILYGDIVNPDDLPYIQIELSDVVKEGGKVFVKEYRIRTKSGDERWVEEQTFIQRNDEGVVTHYMGVIQDITERKNE
ncbi:PAS domain-containing protein [Methanolobus bombayensis]|uniref:PAS domain-containing protein n=1 Tax=Methanolobus bombayensis TaxID=38023 RepID=UPI001AE8BF96|nr:PAS domain-containing protein [Methanolobus bombayensis]MBP1908395.1 PAS domain S-box-containing protein [Methanolobus bombayensis]